MLDSLALNIKTKTMATLFSAYEASLPTDYGSVFGVTPAITNLEQLFDTSTGDMASRSETGFKSSTELADHFINNFVSKVAEADSPCSKSELSMLFPSPSERIFIDYLEELMEKGYSVGGTVLNNLEEMMQFILDDDSNPIILTNALKDSIAASKCNSVLHQKTGSYLQDSASTFITNSKKTLSPVIKLPLVNGAEYSSQYLVEIVNSSNEVIMQLPLNEDGTITFNDQYYDIPGLGPSEQLSFDGTIRLKDSNGGNLHTIKDELGADFEISFPGDFLATTFITIEISEYNTLNLELPITANEYLFNESDITSSLFVSIEDIFSFSPEFITWITDEFNVDYKTPNQIFDDPLGFITSATTEEEARAFLALITFNLITIDIKVATRLVQGGYRSITDVASAPLEDIINLENVDDYDDITMNPETGTFDFSKITQVGDYQLFEVHEMAKLTTNILFNQVLDINAQ